FDPVDFFADVFGFEMKEHAQAIERILAFAAIVNISAQRKLAILEAPLLQSLVPHSAVPALVVYPTGRVNDEIPFQLIGERINQKPCVLDRPNLVEVADGASKLQPDTLPVRVRAIHDVGPVKSQMMEPFSPHRHFGRSEISGLRLRNGARLIHRDSAD